MAEIMVPKYLDIDFASLKERIKDQLADTATFRDYNFEGSNISLIIELVSYLGALTTYYLNKVAQNQYIDTADIYETVHMLSRLRGYNPQGYRSSATEVTVTISTSGTDVSPGDEINIPAWKTLSCATLVDSNGDPLKFATVASTTITVPTSATTSHTFTLPVRQGIVTTYSYKGTDLIENALYLPFEKFDYDDIDETTTPSVQVAVGDAIWTRVSDFYSLLSGLEDLETVYMFRFDKYQKYIIDFTEQRSVPLLTDDIVVTLLITEGVDGGAAASEITTPETEFMYNRTTLAWVDNDTLSIANADASTGASDFETIDEIKDASTGALHSQYRNVTKLDYTTHLESRSDVVVANVWGEQDIAPSGSIQEYNKVHISLIPDVWSDGTISTYVLSAGATADIVAPSAYFTDWTEEISTYLEPRKMISTYEQYDLPELVYFSFDVGIRVKRTYVYTNVMNDVRSKLDYYFSSINRSFNETISFLDIQEYILDSTQTSVDGETWAQVKGIQSLVIRDIDVLTHTVYEPNVIGNYPVYATDSATYSEYENKLRKITLGFNQFPQIAIDFCTFTEET